jgi:hypothetical protein
MYIGLEAYLEHAIIILSLAGGVIEDDERIE